MAFLPKCDADFTPEYLNDVVKGFKKIIKVDVRKPSTHGAVSNTRRIFLSYDSTTEGESPTTIIAKFTIAKEETLFGQQNLDMGKDLYCNKREVFFYQTITETSLIPKIYYSQIDENQDFVLLMEDCASKGVCAEEGEDNKMMQYVQVGNATKAIQDLAKFHAPFYSLNHFDPEKSVERDIKMGNGSSHLKEKGFDWVPERFAMSYSYMAMTTPGSTFKPYGGYGEETKQIMEGALMHVWEASYPLLIEVDYEEFGYADLEIPKKLQVLNENKSAVFKKYSTGLKYSNNESPLTLLHGDFRSDNVVFLEGSPGDENYLKVFDWQTLTVGNGLLDFTHFVYLSMGLRDILEHEENLLDEYKGTLRKEGVDFVSEEDWKKMYEAALVDYLVFGFKMCLFIFAIPKDQRIAGTPQSLIFQKMINMLVALIHNVSKIDMS